MITQYLSNTNESAIIFILKKKLNKAREHTERSLHHYSYRVLYSRSALLLMIRTQTRRPQGNSGVPGRTSADCRFGDTEMNGIFSSDPYLDSPAHTNPATIPLI